MDYPVTAEMTPSHERNAMRRHSPQEQFRQAKAIAKDHGMFIVEKADRFFIYRHLPERNVCLGSCNNTATLFRKVSHCAETQPPRSEA